MACILQYVVSRCPPQKDSSIMTQRLVFNDEVRPLCHERSYQPLMLRSGKSNTVRGHFRARKLGLCIHHPKVATPHRCRARRRPLLRPCCARHQACGHRYMLCTRALLYRGKPAVRQHRRVSRFYNASAPLWGGLAVGAGYWYVHLMLVHD